MTTIERGSVTRTAKAYDGMITGTVDLAGIPAQALADAHMPILEVVVQNDPSSNNNVTVGNADNQFIVLIAGASITIPVNNLAIVFVGSAGATVNWLAYT